MSMSSSTEALSRAGSRPRAAAHVDLTVHGHAPVHHGLRSWQRRHRLRTLVADTTAALLGLVAGLWARDVVLGEDPSLWGSPEATRATSVVIAVLWLLLLTRSGAYAPQFIGGGNEEYRAVGQAAGTLVAVVAVASFAFKLEFSRGVLLVAVPTMLAATVSARHLLRRRLAAARDRGHCLQPAVLVGDARAVVDLAARIRAAPRTTGLRVEGVCVTDPGNPVIRSDEFADIPVLGADADTLDAVDRVGAEVVAVVTGPSTAGHALRRLGWALEQRDVDLLIDPGVIEVAGPRLSLRQASGLPMLHVERPVCSGVRYAAKLIVDRLLALLLLVVIGPALLLVGLVVRLDSRGPALFRQERVGEGGRTFTLFKLRTMCTDADAQLDGLQDRHDGNETLFKLRQDPRVTRVGALLRRYSLDELPQLLNVVRGEMSLVGPRPPLPSEVDRYESDAVRRLRVRPGMTGLWQVSGRSDLSWVESVRLDLWYVDNWSLSLDAQILVRTFSAVVTGKGAY
ncbi:MAG: Undecaprenyl-phosphate galactose phosphotransferase [Ornithinibacter sp.]|nr:Undecaprenyl-phosphate galactose phosphotransferase [Ornithinibacter sp.]